MDEATGRDADAASPPAAAAKPEPRRRRSLSGLILRALLLVFIGWELAVWQSDTIAGYLPEAVAAWVTPQPRDQTSLRRIAHLETAMAELRTARPPAPATEEALARAAARLDAVEALIAQIETEAAAPDPGVFAEVGALERAVERISELEASVRPLRDELAAIQARLDAPVPSPAQTLDAALGAKIDRLATRLASVEDAQGARSASEAALRDRLAAVAAERSGDGSPTAGVDGARVAALEAGQAELSSRIDALSREARSGRRAVSIALALSGIDRALTLGAPFGETLAELEAAAGEPAPSALASAAQTGAPTREALKAGFPAAAHAAIAATLVQRAGGEGGALGDMLARIQARFTGLPTHPETGESAPAILSRAHHALLSGDLDGAVAAVSNLPFAGQAAMGGWLRDARIRAAADHALADWRLALEAAL